MSTINKETSGFVQFILGFLFGAIVFAFVVVIATMLQARLPQQYCPSGGLRTGGAACIPAVEYALLKAARLGPAVVAPIARPSLGLTDLQLQLISGGILAVLGGVLFAVPPSRARIEIFLVIFALLVGLTAFLILMLIVTA
jgi:hypothetical protein